MATVPTVTMPDHGEFFDRQCVHCNPCDCRSRSAQRASYPPSGIWSVNALHLIVPVITAPSLAVALIVNVPPAPDVLRVTFPEPATESFPPRLTVSMMYPLAGMSTCSENMSPDLFLGRHRVSPMDRFGSINEAVHFSATTFSMDATGTYSHFALP